MRILNILFLFIVFICSHFTVFWSTQLCMALVFENWDDIFKLLCPMGQWMFPNIIGLWYCLVFGYFLSPVSCKPTGFCNPMHCGKKKGVARSWCNGVLATGFLCFFLSLQYSTIHCPLGQKENILTMYWPNKKDHTYNVNPIGIMIFTCLLINHTYMSWHKMKTILTCLSLFRLPSNGMMRKLFFQTQFVKWNWCKFKFANFILDIYFYQVPKKVQTCEIRNHTLVSNLIWNFLLLKINYDTA